MKKSQKTIIMEMVSQLTDAEKKVLREDCKSVLSIHEDMQGSYFFKPPTYSNQVRSFELNNSQTKSFKLGGTSYRVEQVTTCSRKNVYYSLDIYTTEGKSDLSLNISFIKKILEAIEEN